MSEWVDCGFCGRRGRSPIGRMTAIGAGGQDAPLMCERCVEKNDREVRAELAADMAGEPPLEICTGHRADGMGCHMPVRTCPSCGAKGCSTPGCSLQGADAGGCKKCGKPGMAVPLRGSASAR